MDNSMANKNRKITNLLLRGGFQNFGISVNVLNGLA